MGTVIVDFLNIFVGLRKTIVMLLLMIIGVAFRIKALLSGQEFVSLFTTTVVSYFGANSVEHFSAMIKAHLESKKVSVPLIDSSDSNN